ncbi:hypothetical protein [Paenibacillus sp. MABNR03]|uniref:hypothetical protein n=1 Tax=Paenibacillus sp. MABNR03 TaxID=3142626 RepID=UPI003D27EECA
MKSNRHLLPRLLLLLVSAGYWSSKEIVDLSVYVGLGIDLENESPFEKKCEHKFSGAGVYSRKINRWIGSLTQIHMEGLSWIQGRAHRGVIKTYRKNRGVP